MVSKIPNVHYTNKYTHNTNMTPKGQPLLHTNNILSSTMTSGSRHKEKVVHNATVATTEMARLADEEKAKPKCTLATQQKRERTTTHKVHLPATKPAIGCSTRNTHANNICPKGQKKAHLGEQVVMEGWLTPSE